MPVTEVEFVPYPKQREFLTATEPTVCFRGGAGSGKTFAGVIWALVRACGWPGARGMIVSASHPQLEQAVMPHLLSVAEKSGLLQAWDWNKSKNVISIPGGGQFWLRSADTPEAILGADLAWLWGDEVGRWKRQAWDFATGRLRQPGYQHQIAVTFTPKGRNWAASAFARSTEATRVVAARSTDNPFLKAFFDRLRQEYGDGTHMWRQEVLGEFVAFEGLVYPQFSVDEHVSDPPEGVAWATVMAGVDWGWTNPGVILVGGLDGDGCLWIIDEAYESNRAIDWWASEAKRLKQSRHVSLFHADPSEPANIAVFKRDVGQCNPAANAVVPGISAVGGRLQNGTLRISPKCENLIRELGLYCWKTRQDGTTRADEPDKVNDHTCDALRYLCMGVTRRPSIRIL
jgi:PBSX family phage terminase large subunit